MPKLLYLVTEDWFFVSHFLPMARTARAAGFEVVVATRVRDHAARIEAEGCRVVPLEGERRSLGIVEALRGFARIVRDRARRAAGHRALHRAAHGRARRARRAGRRREAPGARADRAWPAVERGGRYQSRGARCAALRHRAMAARRDTRYLFENTDDPREFGLTGLACRHDRAGRGRRSAATFRHRRSRRRRR